METILVTGGAGFIGSSIAESLLHAGYRVVVLDDLSTGRLENIDHLLHASGFTFVRGSVLDRGLLRSVLRTYHVSAISHQAAIASVTRSIIEPSASVEANITGSANVFDLASEAHCRRVVFASSCAVYGNRPESPKRESHPVDPRSPYAVTKAAKEMLARSLCDLHSIQIIGLRYFNVYGRRQNPASDYAAVIPAFITRALRNEPLPVEGDGLQTRDFVYIDDVVQANIKALTSTKVSRGCFNIGSGTSISILDLARQIVAASASESAISHRPARAGDVRDSLADLSRARAELGFAPEFPIERGLAGAIAWYRAHEAKKAPEPPLPSSAGEAVQAA